MLIISLTMNAAAGSLTRPDAAASPPDADPDWSCVQTQWANCIEVVIDPPAPCAGQPINVSVVASKPDDFVRLAILHYAYTIPHGNRTPSISYYDLQMQNVSNAANKEAWIELPGYLGGTRIELFVDVYDLKNERLHSDPQFLDICGYDGWPDSCPVPTGFDDCIATEFGYYAGARPVLVADGGQVPAYGLLFVKMTSMLGVPMSTASIIYGFYEPGSRCDEPGKVVVTGPYYESVEVGRPNRTTATLSSLSTSEAKLVLCFTLTATDHYARTLVSDHYTLVTWDGPIQCGHQVLTLTVVVQVFDERISKATALEGVKVTISNSSGYEIENYTSPTGRASFWTVTILLPPSCDSEVWTIRASYRGAIVELREKLPNREREASGNYTFYLSFVISAQHHPAQEAADPGYFAWMAAGLLGFIAIFAPLASRHFVEKRRREELKRTEKEMRFEI